MGLLYDYHELLTLGFVKVTYGYVKKAESIIYDPAFFIEIYIFNCY